MHDYMKALYHRFEPPSRRVEYLDGKIKKLTTSSPAYWINQGENCSCG